MASNLGITDLSESIQQARIKAQQVQLAATEHSRAIRPEVLHAWVPADYWLAPAPVRSKWVGAKLKTKAVSVCCRHGANDALIIEKKQGQATTTLSVEDIQELKPHVSLRGSHNRLLVIEGELVGQYVRRVKETKHKQLAVNVVKVKMNPGALDTVYPNPIYRLSSSSLCNAHETNEDRSMHLSMAKSLALGQYQGLPV